MNRYAVRHDVGGCIDGWRFRLRDVVPGLRRRRILMLLLAHGAASRSWCVCLLVRRSQGPLRRGQELLPEELRRVGRWGGWALSRCGLRRLLHFRKRRLRIRKRRLCTRCLREIFSRGAHGLPPNTVHPKRLRSGVTSKSALQLAAKGKGCSVRDEISSTYY
jgi:hypothetical protein